jgi:hypothetical protein
MRLILSRKGFDSSSGGCPSPIFPDGSMIALPIPDKRSPTRYLDLVWRGRNLGELVATLTKGRQRPDFRAHLDPDLRKDILPRGPGWRAALGQHGIAQGHLRKQGVRAGDLFLFWGLLRAVDNGLRWVGRLEHHIWGWMQVGDVVPVDDVVRGGGEEWRWASPHPHLAFPPDPANTLYVASKNLSFPGVTTGSRRGHGTFEAVAASRRLTAPGAGSPLDWSLPAGFLPRGRPPLTHHHDPARWSTYRGRALLRAASRGQEFILDLELYPDVLEWVAGILSDGSSPLGG